ncbi:hypothetical protein PR202_ga17184 [Eleusine coracana subsp. coracana]|uniref:Uncharacterized protein n=1 Tax=Eleusine coracana subsp. coracana TaxID=191504 RepID=A0AAV5CPH4_ELECO|nr:hypothetical protein PR202_ga17184 [Eleusine coracana subsp. coracana]
MGEPPPEESVRLRYSGAGLLHRKKCLHGSRLGMLRWVEPAGVMCASVMNAAMTMDKTTASKVCFSCFTSCFLENTSCYCSDDTVTVSLIGETGCAGDDGLLLFLH